MGGQWHVKPKNLETSVHEARNGKRSFDLFPSETRTSNNLEPNVPCPRVFGERHLEGERHIWIFARTSLGMLASILAAREM